MYLNKTTVIYLIETDIDICLVHVHVHKKCLDSIVKYVFDIFINISFGYNKINIINILFELKS